MANIVITPANSDSDGISNADTDNNLLVTSGAFVTNPTSFAIVFTGSGTHDISIDGTVGSASDFAFAIEIFAGTFSLTVGQSGYVSTAGFVAIDVIGANSSTIVNAGTITALNNTAIQGSDPGIDSITNVGLIVGDLALFGGNDIYDGRGGIISGNVLMGDGNDTVFGGDGVEIVFGGVGDDTIHLGGGDDTFKVDGGGDGDDFINGGDGIDTYDATSAAFGITVDLGEGLASSLTPGSGIGNDHLESIENVIGSAFADSLTGDAFANVLKGLAGIDKLVGAGGNDTLDGGDGADILTGGAGRDLLYGGGADGDTDLFDFNKVTESGTTGGTRDHIVDFEDGFDKIDLHDIDAMTFKKGNQNFHFIAGAFTSAGGEVHAFVNGAGNTVIEVNTDHDKAAEMSIVLIGNVALTGADFVL